MEGMYKNKKILGVQHTYDADDNDILAVITDGVLLKWVRNMDLLHYIDNKNSLLDS